MPAQPSQSDAEASDKKSHLPRDLLLAVIVPAISTVAGAQSTPAANIHIDNTPTITHQRDVAPEPLALAPEVEQYAEAKERDRERREQEARELPFALRPPEQVEDRRRDDRER